MLSLRDWIEHSPVLMTGLQVPDGWVSEAAKGIIIVLGTTFAVQYRMQGDIENLITEGKAREVRMIESNKEREVRLERALEESERRFVTEMSRLRSEFGAAISDVKNYDARVDGKLDAHIQSAGAKLESIQMDIIRHRAIEEANNARGKK